ncbi:hypothetical protein TanjilG_32792 [Lupinus angustifolius]|uniref:CCT domain-containing protein n=1 Tax=Lupinus angustifolius TaxID=3871 RepID=A0A4P1RFH3_LUPAN|nr:PREDICTED: zinc finger protein CONSTANS-LIKE 16-like isoform X1 [Lupinus angustifolius]OIW10052.1 hypothetical protein TanjilG_32792 [Lupinus angustifolius]
MITDMKAASALAAKTARACDSCLRRRARWFCAADDAFLCHGCDSLVHSANQLANRHERVKLQSASNKVTTTAQSWHSGFTRKARTPRNNKHLALQQRLKHKVFFNNTNVLPIVPELGGEEEQVFDDEESEEQMLCRVPVLEPFDAAAEFCHVYNNGLSVETDAANEAASDLDSFSEFLASDMDLSEFAADVQSLLGSSEQVFDCKEECEIDGRGANGANAVMKVKDEGLDEDTACHFESVFDMTNEAFDWNIDSVLSSAPTAPPQEEKAVVSVAAPESKMETKRDIILRLKLNYEEVITAWASQGSPWTTENPPRFNFDECWPDFLDSSSGGDVQFSSYGELRSLRGHLVDEGREARVSRYREKRRTRLFAKKIRYEVRKLNAEKRPRMKGRFVKRTCFVGGANNAFH